MLVSSFFVVCLTLFLKLNLYLDLILYIVFSCSFISLKFIMVNFLFYLNFYLPQVSLFLLVIYNTIFMVYINYIKFYILYFLFSVSFYLLSILESSSILLILLEILLIIVGVLIAVAFFTLVERKVLGFMQRRRGPNVVGIFGVFQPLADGVKLFLKQTNIPTSANQIIFVVAPFITLLLSLMSWAVIPFYYGVVYSDINLGLLYLWAVSSLGAYGILCSGWSSNSKYSFLGSLRAAAQMISYEVSLGLIFLNVIICVGSQNLTEIGDFQAIASFFFFLYPAFIMFLISALAETNRPPFDLPEAEAELVAGFNVEYSSMTFASFFLAEYANMLVMCALNALLFFGCWHSFFYFEDSILYFLIKICFFVFVFVWVRSSFPRLRYDQLMFLGWKVLLPISLGFLLLISTIVW